MNPHYSANIASKIPPARGDCKILRRIETIGVNHEIAIVLVDRRGLTPVPVVEEFRHSLFLEGMYSLHVEPCTIAGQDNGVSLLC